MKLAFMIWMAAITIIVLVLDLVCVAMVITFIHRNSKRNDELRNEIYAQLKKQKDDHKCNCNTCQCACTDSENK